MPFTSPMTHVLPVSEIMSKEPLTIRPESTVARAAKLMSERGIGSLVVVKKDKPVGIVTERDMLVKVLAEGRDPKRTKVANVMSSRLVVISPSTDIAAAARTMAKMKIRRLPVVSGSKLVGMLTEKDVLRVAPELIEVVREYSNINAVAGDIRTIPGFCEFCMNFSEELDVAEGQLACPACAREHKE